MVATDEKYKLKFKLKFKVIIFGLRLSKIFTFNFYFI